MEWFFSTEIARMIQHGISLLGAFIILSGILIAVVQYCLHFFLKANKKSGNINLIRLNLGRTLVLGLEFIVAADLIGTTIAPDYYTLGLVGGIVLIRTLLSFSLNREIASLSKENVLTT